VLEIGGSIYQVTSAETINGSVTSSSTNYILFDSSTPEFQWTTTAPTWSDDKQGYYDAGEAKRYVGGCYYDGSDYTLKFVYGNNHKRRKSGEEIVDLGTDAVGAGNLATTATFGTGTVTGYAIKVPFTDASVTYYTDIQHGSGTESVHVFFYPSDVPIGAIVTHVVWHAKEASDDAKIDTRLLYAEDDDESWTDLGEVANYDLESAEWKEYAIVGDFSSTNITMTKGMRIRVTLESDNAGDGASRIYRVGLKYTLDRFAY
jgi:hypothetical protein